ncbi:Uncharacterised protein [uncultured Clostridium sp.]|nr:Uncharacterised protein [uncultured Clostridium sp.]
MGILFLHLFKPGKALGFSFFQHSRGCRRDHRERHDEGGHQAVTDAQGHGHHQAAHNAGREHHRQEHAHRGKGGGHHRHAHLFCALHGSAGRRHAAAAQTVDVLNDDHRVIHQHTNAEGKAGQGHHVQVQPGKVHEHHREQNGQRDADADHEGGLDILQEDGQHDDGQCSAHHHAGEDAVDDDGDVVALIGQHHHVQAVVLFFQLFKCGQAVVGDLACTGSRILIDFEDGCLFAVQAGVAVGGVINDLHIRHIRKAHVAVALHMQQQGTADILHTVVLFADFQQPGLAVLILHVTGRHGEVLGIDELRQRFNVQLLCHIGLCQSVGLGRLVLCLGSLQLLFVLVQHFTRFGELHIGVELLLGEAAQCAGELGHQLGHIVHGLDGAFQRVIDHIQAFLQLHLIGKILCGAAFGAGLGVHALLQLLQGGSDLIGNGAQLSHNIDQRVDIPHTGLVELVHDLLQTVAHLDQGLLDLRLLDHGDQAVHTFQKSLRLRAHRFHCGTHLGAHLAHDRVGHRIAKVFQLLFVFLASGGDLCLGAFQLGAGCSQLGIDQFQQLCVDPVDLILIELHLHQLFHQTAGRNAGHTALALHFRHKGVLDKLRKLVLVGTFAADSHRHESVHVQAVLNDGGGQAGAGQVAFGLIQLVGHLDQRAVHIRILGKLHQQQAVVFCRCCGDLGHARHCERVLQHIRDLALHALRACTRIHGDHHQIRCVHVGQQVRIHLCDRHKAQDQDHDHCNQHRKRLFDTEFFHFLLPFLCLAAKQDSCFPCGKGYTSTFLLYTQAPALQERGGILLRFFRYFRKILTFTVPFFHFPAAGATKFGQSSFMDTRQQGRLLHLFKIFLLKRQSRFLFFAWKCAFEYVILEYRMDQQALFRALSYRFDR